MVAAVAVAAMSFLTGVVTSRASPRRAALVALEGRVVTEPVAAAVTADDPAPTSGPLAAEASCGVVREPVAAQAQVDALGRGAVVVQYDASDVATADVAQLQALAAEFGSHVLVAPQVSLDAPLVATAWRRRMELDAFDPALVRNFVVAFRERGPFPGPCPL